MTKFRLVKFKGVVVKDYDKTLVKRDLLEMFWCLHYQQFTCMGICTWRFQGNPVFQFARCNNCATRKATFSALRVPRIVLRKPREKSDADD